VAAGVALLLGLLVAFRVTAPLERVTAVARRMVHGEIETRASGWGGNRETRELAQTLDRLAAALRRQDELRRATGADVAHELRNAMVGVMGRLEALQDGVVQDEQATIARALRDARRVHRLVDDVVLLSEAQRPSVLVRTQPVGFDEIVSEQTAAHVDDFADRGIELTCSLTPALVDGDPGRLTQIVENLLSNAHRYTDPGGRVDVRSRSAASTPCCRSPTRASASIRRCSPRVRPLLAGARGARAGGGGVRCRPRPRPRPGARPGGAGGRAEPARPRVHVQRLHPARRRGRGGGRRPAARRRGGRSHARRARRRPGLTAGRTTRARAGARSALAGRDRDAVRLQREPQPLPVLGAARIEPRELVQPVER
jgi:HAMP domain-containing protein